MDSNIFETEENKIIEVEESNNNIITPDNSSMEWVKTILAKLSVPYNDPNVLLTNTPELELVNRYFESISCRR